jgi:acyl-CoA hydrolase
MKSNPFDRQPTIRTIAMPADTNSSGDIFGGWPMGQMDLAAGSTAVRRARCRVATVAVESMAIHGWPVRAMTAEVRSRIHHFNKLGSSKIHVRSNHNA